MITNEDIKNMRLSTGMSQAEFGKGLGVTAVTVSSWELGKTTPQPKMRTQIRGFTASHGGRIYETEEPAAETEATEKDSVPDYTDPLEIQKILADNKVLRAETEKLRSDLVKAHQVEPTDIVLSVYKAETMVSKLSFVQGWLLSLTGTRVEPAAHTCENLIGHVIGEIRSIEDKQQRKGGKK